VGQIPIGVDKAPDRDPTDAYKRAAALVPFSENQIAVAIRLRCCEETNGQLTFRAACAR